MCVVCVCRVCPEYMWKSVQEPVFSSHVGPGDQTQVTLGSKHLSPQSHLSSLRNSLSLSLLICVGWWWHTGFSISIEENALRGPEESVSRDSPCPCRTASPGPEQAFSAEKAKAREAYKGKRAGVEVRLASLWNQWFHLSCLEFSACSEHEHCGDGTGQHTCFLGVLPLSTWDVLKSVLTLPPLTASCSRRNLPVPVTPSGEECNLAMDLPANRAAYR